MSRFTIFTATAAAVLGSVLGANTANAEHSSITNQAARTQLVRPVADGERNVPVTSPAIVGGSTASSAPFIVALLKNGSFNCTASIIAPQWVITAKHCVGSGITLRIGSLNRTSGGTMANVAQIYNAPGNNDVSLLRLSSSVNATYLPVAATGSLSVGTQERVYGWGYTQSNWTNLATYLKTSNGSVTQLNCNTSFGDIACIRNNGDTAGGDSGGPMINNSGQLIGVCSIGNKPTNGTGFGGYNTVVSSTVRNWIRTTAGV